MGQEIMFGDILELWNSIKKKNMIFYFFNFFYFRVDNNRNDKGNVTIAQTQSLKLPPSSRLSSEFFP